LPPWLPRWRQHVDTLSRGETLVDALTRGGVERSAAARVLREAGPLARMPARAGTTVYTRGLAADSLPAEITFRPEADRVVRLTFLRGAWRAAEERLAWRTDTVRAEAVVRTSLDDAVRVAFGARLPGRVRSDLVDTVARVFEYRVDVGDDLEAGDSVRVVVERRVDPEGTPREARLLAASLTTNGRPVEAIRFRSAGRSADFFDASGKSLRAAFLRAPLAFRRVSSSFGMRHHPILGVWKMHAGTDYAAASGTPVRAVGDGTVLFAGRKGGYGNVIEVRHRNGYVSRYGHLRAFAPGVRRGASLAMGGTIGYVGMTGLATAPHLHFEMLIGGDQRDPRATLRRADADVLPSRERRTFSALRARLLAPGAAGARGPAHVASAE
jgi:murein DD-endopeptidase MepM/ murein hydrolase activator NlpD